MKINRLFVPVGVALLLAVPALLSESLVNACTQMLIAALFASAFNVLCGQGGMLSFGHAAYFGVGAFATVHAMNAFNGAGLLPTPLMPLAGGVIGLLVGVVAGFFATKRTGTYFAMITLALAELIHALAPHLKSLFGGEAGVSTMRMPAWGVTFGTTTHVYYLVLAWVLGSLALLYLFTLTPMGRLTLGLRENTQRLKFLGYDVDRLKVAVFSISAMFSGVAGGLQAINTESANYILFEGYASSVVVLNAYIGGVKVFLGPAMGASLMTFFGYAASDLTRSWLLYQGVVFVMVMMFMPSGLTGFFRWWANSRKAYGTLPVVRILAIGLVAAVLLSVGSVFTVELLQRFFSQDYRSIAALNPAMGWPPIDLFGRKWAPVAFGTWIAPVLLFVGGGVIVRFALGQWRRLVDAEETVRANLESVAAQGDAS